MEDYQITLDAWRGNTPVQCKRRLAVKEAGFWAEAGSQLNIPDGAGLIARKAAQQAQALRFPEYDPHSDPHLQAFFERQQERQISVREFMQQQARRREEQRLREMERRLELERSHADGTSKRTVLRSHRRAAALRTASPGSQSQLPRFRSGRGVQASLAKVSRHASSMRQPKPPPHAVQPPAPPPKRSTTPRGAARQSLPLHLRQAREHNELNAPVGSVGLYYGSNIGLPSSSSPSPFSHRAATAADEHPLLPQLKLNLQDAAEMCPELKSLQAFRSQQLRREAKARREAQRRVLHQATITGGGGSPYQSSSSSHQQHFTSSAAAAGVGGGGAAVPTTTICMPVDSSHILAIKRLFMRSAVSRTDIACRAPVCALQQLGEMNHRVHETFHVIVTREVDLPDVIYMGIALSNHARQICGLPHMSATPSPEQIYNWLVVLECTETVDWPSFLLMCSADLIVDFDRVSDIKGAYAQFCEKTPLDCGLAYEKLLVYLSSVAGLHNDGDQRSERESEKQKQRQHAQGRRESFHANAFHESSATIVTQQHHQRHVSAFFQPGDFYGPRHTCSFADALFSLMPSRVQFHLIKANSRGFSCSTNFRGRVSHSQAAGLAGGGASDDGSASAHSGRSAGAGAGGARPRSSGSTGSRRRPHSGASKRSSSAGGSVVSEEGAQENENDGDDNTSKRHRPIRHSKFKNQKSRFLEEQAAETRYVRKVWL